MQMHPKWHWFRRDCQIDFAQLAFPLQLLEYLLTISIFSQNNTPTDTGIDTMTNQWTRDGYTTYGRKGA
jgi:hypothetical protein